MPTVSVVMAVYNGMPYLPEAVQGILGQTYSDFEFIIIDDGSTDESFGWLEAVSRDDNRIVLLRNKENRGLTPTLNRGLSQATGTYIARMDADDIALSDRFEKQVDFLNTHPETLLLGTLRMDFVNNPPPEAQIHSYREETKRQHDETVKSLSFGDFLEGNELTHSSVMYRRSLVENGLRYREAFRITEDYDFWLRIALQGDVARLNQVLLLYRRLTNAISFQKAYDLRLYHEYARTLAAERQRSGTDALDREGHFPDLPGDVIARVKRDTVRNLFRFARTMREHGAWWAAGQLYARAFLFRPDMAAREFAVQCLGSHRASRLLRVIRPDAERPHSEAKQER